MNENEVVKFDREISDALFVDALSDLDNLNTRDGRFEYSDYVTLHNDITGLYDSFSGIDPRVEQLKSRANTIKVIRCKDCDHFRAKRVLNGEPLSYICCRTNGYSPGREHYCAWAEQSLVPERYRYTAGCTSYYSEERTKVNE